MDADEFIAEYCKRSDISVELFKSRYVALPCACGEALCQGWAKVRNLPEDIDMHNELYAPKDRT